MFFFHTQKYIRRQTFGPPSIGLLDIYYLYKEIIKILPIFRKFKILTLYRYLLILKTHIILSTRWIRYALCTLININDNI